MTNLKDELSKEVAKNKMDAIVIDTELENNKKDFANKMLNGYGEDMNKYLTMYNGSVVIKLKKPLKERINDFFVKIKLILNL